MSARVPRSICNPTAANRPGKHVAVALAVECGLDVGGLLAGGWDACEMELEEVSVGRRFPKPFRVIENERLQAHAMALEHNRTGVDHENGGYPQTG